VTHNVFDPVFNGMGRSEMYRAWITPELFPHEKPALLENWSIDDLQMFVGGDFTPGYLRLVKEDA
jgi:hypothetical protein